jgi:hypothetical protein
MVGKIFPWVLGGRALTPDVAAARVMPTAD